MLNSGGTFALRLLLWVYILLLFIGPFVVRHSCPEQRFLPDPFLFASLLGLRLASSDSISYHFFIPVKEAYYYYYYYKLL
jgi:hypothetical protein